MKCKVCDSEKLKIEKCPDGWTTCMDCGATWKNRKETLSEEELEVLREQFVKEELKREPLVETILKAKLEPGDDLIVKLRGEMDSVESMRTLKEKLETMYPANRVLLFYLPEGSDIDFSIIKKI